MVPDLTFVTYDIAVGAALGTEFELLDVCKVVLQCAGADDSVALASRYCRASAETRMGMP